MANMAKTSIGNSVSYKIGGRNYSAKDVSHLQPSQTGNAKTGTDISRESVSKVQTQTDNYNKTGAHDPSKAGVQSQVTSTPRTIESIKTGAAEQSTVTPYKSIAQSGEIHITQPLPGSKTVQPMPMQSVQSMGAGNLKTQSSISKEAVHKIQSQTDSYNKTGAYNTPEPSIRDRVDKSPTNIARIQTGSVKMTQGAHTSFFDAVNSTKGRPFSLANCTMTVAGKAESALSGQEDFGVQSAGAVIETGIVGAETFRAAQTAAEGIYKTGKGIYQVGLTGGLAIVAVSRTAAFVQSGQFQAISQASMQMLKAQALATGLNQTAISQGILHAVNGIQTKLQNGIQTAKYVGNHAPNWPLPA